MSKHLKGLCYQNLIAYNIGHQKFAFNIAKAHWILAPMKRFSIMISSEKNVHIIISLVGQARAMLAHYQTCC
jgi:hypothetical protein